MKRHVSNASQNDVEARRRFAKSPTGSVIGLALRAILRFASTIDDGELSYLTSSPSAG